MTIVLLHSARLVVKRSFQRSHNLSTSAKRYTSSVPERPSDKPTPSSDKIQGKSISTAPEINPKPIWERLGPLSQVVGAYDRTQQRRPWIIQLSTSLVVYLCGDLIAQNIDGDEYNPARTLRHLTIGGVSSIPAYTWFMYLNSCFNYPSKVLSIATKVIVNQIVFTPIFNSYFFGMQSLLSGDSLNDAWDRITRTVPTSFINSLKLWPAVTAFNFTYVAPQYRAIFAGVVAVGWQSYLSWLNQRAARAERLDKQRLLG
ncbi:hypothetical protein ACLMJK_007431 [Lecanora helva]